MKAKFERGMLHLTGETLEEKAWLRYVYSKQSQLKIYPGGYTFDTDTMHVTVHSLGKSINLESELLKYKKAEIESEINSCG